jgi:YHS domain-containing protein
LRKKDMKNLLVSVVLTVLATTVFAQSEVFSESSEAIHGYDPVAYFKEGKPVKGKKEVAFTWKGATWLFSSEQNRTDFKTNPDKFSPQFGGYCAYGVADGHKAPTSPDAWTIVDGKLYLNYDTDVRALWNKDRDGFIKKANGNWPSVRKEKD